MKFSNRDIMKLLTATDVLYMVDAKRLLCGKKIGSGVYRDVYEFKHDPENFVVKVEKKDGMFCNATEFRNWVNSYETPLREYLCPIEGITDDGRVMIMERVVFKSKFSDYPKKMPQLFMDFKIENYGFLKDGRCVCVDYANLLLQDETVHKNVKWWTVSAPPKKRK